MEETSKADIRHWDQLFLELETLLPFLTWVLLLHLWTHLPFSEVTDASGKYCRVRAAQ